MQSPEEVVAYIDLATSLRATAARPSSRPSPSPNSLYNAMYNACLCVHGIVLNWTSAL